MSTTRYYKVGGHLFSVSGEAVCFELMTNYEPFEVQVAETREGETCFALSMEDGFPPAFTEELRQDEEGQVIVCGKTADGKAVFEYQWWDATAGWLVCTADYRKGCLLTTGKHTKMAIDNALMVLYALGTANKGTALFHAAVVSHEGQGYMFLGKALERQDILLPQHQLSFRRTGAAEPSPTQQDTPSKRHRGLCGTGSEHQRQAVGRPHCRRSAPDGRRNGKPCTGMASGVSAR